MISVQRKKKIGNENSTRKQPRINFCTHQCLYVSEYIELGLRSKLYLPPLECLGSFCGVVSVVGSLISSVEGLSLCLDGGYGIGSHAVSASVLDSDVCSDIIVS